MYVRIVVDNLLKMLHGFNTHFFKKQIQKKNKKKGKEKSLFDLFPIVNWI